MLLPATLSPRRRAAALDGNLWLCMRVVPAAHRSTRFRSATGATTCFARRMRAQLNFAENVRRSWCS